MRSKPSTPTTTSLRSPTCARSAASSTPAVRWPGAIWATGPPSSGCARAWRGIGFEVVAAGLGEGIDPDAHDLFYIGGAQDRDQALCAQDMVDTKRDALHAAADAGRVVLAVCGGYQLLGHHYELADERIPGVGLVDLYTVREPGPRLIGNVAIEVRLPGL